ncbi:MAG: TolC family protein [Trueperaceae bacterium]|nr:TolC family protein [Trueperaceae bacterium]
MTGRTALAPAPTRGARSWAPVLAVAMALTAGAAFGQASPPRPGAEAVLHVLAGVNDHPSLRAAGAAVEAARRELDGVRFPVSLEAEVGATRASISVDADPGVPDEVLGAVPDHEWTRSATVRARLRPFLVGDLSDLEAQRRLAVVQAERRRREMRAMLEARALQAASATWMAEEGVRVAERALEVARGARDATRTRARLGAASERDQQRAALELARAEQRRRSAEARRDEAVRRLEALVGPDRGLAGIPEVPDVGGVPPEVQDAAHDLAMAQLAVRGAERDLLPTAQASYAWNTGDGSLSLSLESRTFQPTVSYATPGSFSGATADVDVPEGIEPRVDSTLSVGLSVAFGGEPFAARDAAQARRAAAEAGMQAARREADLARADRQEAARAARAEVALAEQDLALARAEADDARRREELGLTSPLEVRRAEVAARQAALALASAHDQRLSAQLRAYLELAVPLSEVLP